MFYSATTTQDGVAVGRKKGADILSSLFEEANDICASSNPSQAIDAHPHSTNVCCIPASQRWSLQSAYVHGNTLIVFLRSSEKLMLLNVYHASSHSQFDEQRMPIFSSHPLFSHEINSCCGPLNRLNQKSTEDTIDLLYMPAFFLLCCQSAWKSGSMSLLTPIADVLFQQLFGLEFLLAQSIVALVGSQSGTVLFLDTRGYCNPSLSSDASSLSNTLCCLDQPIISIHALHLPIDTDAHHMDIGDSCGASCTAANALLFFGRLGRVVVVSQAGKDSAAPKITEFTIPGPILSSFLVKNHCIAYSTTRGVYRICLEPECILESEKNDTSHECTNIPIVPVSQIHFPVQVCSSYVSFILNASQLVQGVHNLTAVSISGDGVNFQLKTCKQTEGVSEELDIGRAMKECMNAIQSSSEQAGNAQQELQKVNSALVELNEALSIILPLTQSQVQPFSCTIRTVCEKFGVHYFIGYAEVELHYCGVSTLQRGWTLLVTTQCTGSAESEFTSLSLTGLSANSSVQHRVKLEPITGVPFAISVTASIYFSSTHLHPTYDQHCVSTTPVQATSSTGVSIVVATCVLDALDFIQPSQVPPLKLLQQVPHFSEPDTLQGRSPHSLEMPFPAQVHVDSAVSDSLLAVDRCRATLKVFLPPAIAETASITGDRCVKIQAGYYDGSVVSFEVTDEEGKLKLRIATSTASCMLEVVSCVHRRVLQESNSSSSDFNAEVLTSLQVCG